MARTGRPDEPASGDPRRNATLPDHADRHAALTDFQHNLVVTAGAGTGKTSLLVGRLMSALLLQHLEPHQILAVTFTENAATEMRDRLIRMLESVRPWLDGEQVLESDAYVLEQLDLGPENLSRVNDLLDQVECLTISTFHGFCLGFLQEHAHRLDLPPDLRVGDTAGLHPGFDEVFLDWLKEASEGDVHDALHRFDATELHDLAVEFLELPDDSLDRIANVALPDDLPERLANLEALLDTYPRARPAWRKAGAELSECYRTLIDGGRPQVPAIEKKSPSAGKKNLGDAAATATESLEAHRRFLVPWILADQAGVALAVDFVRPVLRRHRRQAAMRGELAFQDLLLLTRDALMRHADLRVETGRRLRAVLVDEFQDTDPLQYDVVFLLGAEASSPAEGDFDPMELRLRQGTVFIVGDAKQSVYRFRRADVAAFSRAVACVARNGGRQLALTANFRSRPPILEVVNAVCRASLRQDPPYQFGYQDVVPMLDSEAAHPVEVLQVDAHDEKLSSAERRRREGNILVARIEDLRREGTGYDEMAILLRATTETSWVLRPLRAAGIPYVLDGSRRFFQRQEVILSTALINAMARPHDPVPVLAMLRSSFSNATDADIVTHVDDGGTFDYRAAAARDGTGPVASCLSWLRNLHQEIAELPLDASLTRLLTLPEFRLAEGAGFEGAQRLANIERLLHRLLLREPLDLLEAATFLAQNTDVETDDEESPLFDKGVHAVRILTVHKAKGLEFGAVFVPDLARLSSYRDRHGLAQAQRLFDANGIEMVTVRIGDTRNVASLLAKDAGKIHDEAEQRRLFYVAATRPKERLFLIRGEEAGTRRRLWQEDLEAAGDLFERHLTDGKGSRRRAATEPVDPGPALRAFAAHEELRERAWRRLRPDDVAPSRAAPPPALRQLLLDFAKPAETERPSAEEAQAVGSAMHLYLALVDLGADSIDEALLAELPHRDDLRPMAEAYHRSKLRRRLAAADRLHKEVPLTFVDGDGSTVHGVIDLIVEEGDSAVTILDWKTDRLDGVRPKARAEAYRAQLAAYGRGVQMAMGLQELPRTVVQFLRDDVTVQL